VTTRIDARFAALKKEGRSAFVTFLMAGDPDPATSLSIIKAMPRCGADVIEIGMPFTDPMADGPAIDGLIIVDLPAEEDAELCVPALKAGLSFIRLATPTTDDRRLSAVLANTSGFVYYVSITGITGAAAADSGVVGEAVARIKRHTDLPVCVGFGIRTPDAARAIAACADGAVVGTALVDALRASLDAEGRATAKTVNAVADLAASLAHGVRDAKQAAE